VNIMSLKFGLTLPHFGEVAARETILDMAIKAQELNFNSVWARDHLVFKPHVLEDPTPNFIETFITLSAVGTVTDLTLGTSVTFPHRHPLHLAQLYSNLDFMARGDVIAGVGMGSGKREYEIMEMPFDRRSELFKETVEIIRGVWQGDGSYQGEFYSFDDAFQYPLPGEIPIWGGGSSPASVKRAWELCEGWFPGRINMPSFRAGVKLLRKWAKEERESMPMVGAVPITSVGRNRDAARGKINLEGLLNSTKDFWIKPDSGAFKTVEDLEGVLMAGSPEDIVQEVVKFEEAGVNHLVFDLRQRFEEMEECMELISDEVLTEFQ